MCITVRYSIFNIILLAISLNLFSADIPQLETFEVAKLQTGSNEGEVGFNKAVGES